MKKYVKSCQVAVSSLVLLVAYGIQSSYGQQDLIQENSIVGVRNAYSQPNIHSKRSGTLLEMVTLAGVAYRPILQAEKKLTDKKLYELTAETSIFATRLPFGFLAVEEHSEAPVVNVCLRGTENAGDVFTDVNMGLVPLGEIFGGDGKSVLVHRGFQDTAMSALSSLSTQLDAVRQTVGEARFKDIKVRLTGHSLGGALSILVGLWLQQNPVYAPNGVESIVTFGMPAVGDQALIQLVDRVLPDATHVFQPMDLVAQLKLMDYQYPMHRFEVPSRGLFNETNPHAIAGYEISLRAKLGNKPLQRGALVQILDYPLVNKPVIATVNHLGQQGLNYYRL